MNKREYEQRQIKERMRLVWENETATGLDPDVLNLKMILLDIRPYSCWWNRGYMRSLKRAIKALEKEGKAHD